MAWTPSEEEADVWVPGEDEAPLEGAQSVATQSGPSKAESFGRGALQGGTLGFGDEVVGLIGATRGIPGGGLGEKAMALATSSEARKKAVEDYVRARNIERAKNKAAEAANPKTSMAGSLVGGAATAPILPAVGLGGSLGIGAAQALGSSEADLTKGEVLPAVADAAKGAALGWAFHGAGKVLGGAINPKNYETAAEEAAGRSLGFTKAIRKSQGMKPEDVRNVSREVLNKGDIITPLASPEEMYQGVRRMTEEAGEGIGSFLKARGDGFDTKTAIAGLEKLKKVGTPGADLSGSHYAAFNDKIDKAINTLKAEGDVIPFTKANEVKGFLQDLVDWKSPKAAAQLDRDIAGSVRGSIDVELERAAKGEGLNPSAFSKEIDATSGKMTVPMEADEAGEAIENFKTMKKTYQSGVRAESALENKMSMEGNNKVGLTDWILGGSVAAHQGITDPQSLLLGAGAVVAKKAISKYGWNTAAWSAEKIANTLKSNPQLFGKYAPALANAAKRGTQALAAAHFTLQNNDPEYNEMMNSHHNGEE